MPRGQTFSVTLPIPLVKKLDALANITDTSRSGCVRYIITDYFNSLPNDKDNNVIPAHTLQTPETE